MHECPFVSASTVARQFLVVSELAEALGHWDSLAGSFRHCAVANCHLCRQGYGSEYRYLLRLEAEEGGDYLMWLRKRHLPFVEELRAAQKRGQTLRVVVWRAGSAKNSPVEIRSLGAVSSPPLYQISSLLAALMGPAICIERDGSKVEFAPSMVARRA